MRVPAKQTVCAGIFFVAGASVFFCAEYFTNTRTAKGTIVKSGMADRYSVVYRYTYVAGGKSYTSGGRLSSSNSEKRRDYAVGKRVTVYYDPIRPRHSHLWGGEGILFVRILGIASGILGVLFLLPKKASPIPILKDFVNRRRVFRNAWACGIAGGILGGILGVLLAVVAMNLSSHSDGSDPTSGWVRGQIFVLLIGPLFALMGFVPGILAGIAFAKRNGGARGD